tara:strand:+ start:366 stop:617 length:252 start_codon:yes stop_codon:yes gene_type:complete
MPKATITKSSYNQFNFQPLPDQRETIQADDKDSLFALFFREYHNRYKYCNSVSYSLFDPSLREEYSEWLSDINNYADNGGDMW